MSEAIKRYLMWGGNPPKMMEHAMGGYVDYGDHARIVAEREAAARKAALEEACKVMCGWCRIEKKVIPPKTNADRWAHYFRGTRTPCRAAVIRSLMQQPGGEA